MEKVAQETEKSIINAIKINEKEVSDHLNRLGGGHDQKPS